MCIHDLLRHGQAEPGSLALAEACEGLEQTAIHLLWNARARVGTFEHQVLAVALQLPRKLLGASLSRVARQVPEHAFDLAGVEARAACTIPLDLEARAKARERGLEKLARLF